MCTFWVPYGSNYPLTYKGAGWIQYCVKVYNMWAKIFFLLAFTCWHLNFLSITRQQVIFTVPLRPNCLEENIIKGTKPVPFWWYNTIILILYFLVVSTDCFSAFFFQNKVLALMLLFDKVIKLCQRFETCHGTSLFTRTSCKWCPHIFLKKLPASPSANIIPWHCESVIFSSLLLSESYWNINGVPCRWHKIQHLLGTSLLMFIPRGCQENSHRLPWAPATGRTATCAHLHEPFPGTGRFSATAILASSGFNCHCAGGRYHGALTLRNQEICAVLLHVQNQQRHDHPWAFALRRFPTHPLFIISTHPLPSPHTPPPSRSCNPGSVGLMAGLEHLKGLFQAKRFHDSTI